MKTKLFAAALAAMTMLGASVASAQDYRGRDHDRWRDGRDWRRAEITVRVDGRTFDFDRRDRMFYRLSDRPYNFRPGLTYVYTDNCNRRGCQVLVFGERSRRPLDLIFAPHLPGPRFANFRERTWDDRGRDRDWDDRDYRDYRDSDRGRDRDWDGRRD